MEREKIIEVLTHYYKQGEALGYSNAELSRIRSCINKVEAIADELATQPQQKCYPEEFEKFCIWFKKNTQSTDLGYYHVIEEHGRFAFFELYNYWLTNIKDK